MKISVALAAYNGEKHLRDQLDSILAQIRLPDELIICDDNSSDRTVEIAERFRKCAPFNVIVVRNERNLGHVRNFERALSLCSGQIVFLCDQDDVWLPEKIATQVDYLERHSACMVAICDLEICDESMRRSGRTKLSNILDYGLRKDQFITGCAMAIRRPFLQVVLPFPDGELGHDNWIGRVADALGAKDVIPLPLQLYRRHESNTSQWIFSRTTKVKSLDVFREYGLTSSVEGWSREVSGVIAVKSRVSDERAILEELGLSSRIEPALKGLDSRIINIHKRIGLLSRPRIWRWLFLLQFWVDGGYRGFSGWKSALKDLVRP